MNQFDPTAHIDDLQTIWDALLRQDIAPETADVIVVGGCRDLGLAEKAAELYHAGVSSRIIISGYQPEYMEVTEARHLADKCIELGIPTSVIALEEQACNTGQNIRYSAAIAKRVDSVILVHKPYMSLRFLATAEVQWPDPKPKLYSTCQSISFADYAEIHGMTKLAWGMVGDFKRMSEYADKGYQSPQYITNDAKQAYERIIQSGFIAR